jgi:preprotein translocase subunit YajC
MKLDPSLVLSLGQAAPAKPAGWQSLVASIMPMVLIFAIMYFLLIRPQQKRAREHEQLLSQLKAGDRVLTSGGLMGTVTAVKDKTFMLKIADGVVVEVSRTSVASVLDKEKA